MIAWAQGDDARARSLLQDAVERYDRSGVPADAIDPLRYLGLLACATGDLDEAAGGSARMLTRLRQLGSRAALAVGLADVATLAAAREAWQPAVRLFAKAEALLQAEAAAFSLPARDYYERAHARAREALGNPPRPWLPPAGRSPLSKPWRRPRRSWSWTATWVATSRPKMFTTNREVLVGPPYLRGRRSEEDPGAVDPAEVTGHDVAPTNEA